MKVDNAENVEGIDVQMEGASGVTLRWLIGKDDEAPNFYMRQFTLAPGGFTPRHTHSWEHEVYVVSGTGTVFMSEGERPIGEGDFVFVKGDELHQFANASDQGEDFKFLCLVPNSAKA